MSRQHGFTLIELLVTIAIIGILSAVGLVSLNGAREKARDAQRKYDIGSLRTALALYYDDNGNVYPPQTTRVVRGGNGQAIVVVGNLDVLLRRYLSTLPAPPRGGGSTTGGGPDTYVYQVGGGAPNYNQYRIYVQLELANQAGNSWLYVTEDGVTNIGSAPPVCPSPSQPCVP